MPSLAEIGPKPKPLRRPEPKEIDAAIVRAVAFLLSIQNADGSRVSVRSPHPERFIPHG